MIISLTGILFSLLIFQLLFLSFFLFTQEKGKRVSNLLLGVFFLSMALNLLDVFLLMTGVYFFYPALAGWGSPLPLVFGPLLYFYTQSIVYKDFSLSLKKSVHFLPFLIFFCGTEVYYLLLSHGEQEAFLHGASGHHFPRIVSVVSTLIFLLFLCYIIASLRLVTRYRKAAGQFFSDGRQTDMSWLYSMLVFFMGIMVFATFNGLLVQTALAGAYLVAFNLLLLTVLVFINRVLLKALRRPGFFPFREEMQADAGSLRRGGTYFRQDESAEGLADMTGQKVKENERADPEKERIAQVLVQYMESHKPYLESELTLDQLAAQLSLKARNLSQVINEVLGRSFFDFVNRYRIEEARRLLTNPADPKVTVLEVLYQVGFNSKSSFNTLFKKYTGVTPTEFRRGQGGAR